MLVSFSFLGLIVSGKVSDIKIMENFKGSISDREGDSSVSSKAANTLIGYVLFAAIFYLVYKSAGALFSDENGVIVLDGSRIFAPILLAVLGGLVITPIVRIFSPLWSSKDTKRAGACSLGVVFVGGFCFGGACMLSAMIGVAGAVFLLVPFRVGAFISGSFMKKLSP